MWCFTRAPHLPRRVGGEEAAIIRRVDDLLLLASELAAKGEHRLGALGPRAAAGLHTGEGPSTNPKRWPCEDSLALCRLRDDDFLAAVADAHWGGGAGESVARGLRRAWAAGDPRLRPVQRLHRALLQLEARHMAERPADDGSETTALLAHLEGRTLSFVSVGDSFLLVVDPTRGSCALRNQLAGFFLGLRPLASLPGSPIDGGSLTVEPGQIVLLASDGLEESMSGVGPARTVELLTGDDPLEVRLERLLRAGSEAPGGGRDNLALVALEVV